MSVARAGSCKFEPPKRSTGRTKLRVKYTFMDAHQPLFKRRSSAASLIQRCFRGFTVRRAWRHRIYKVNLTYEITLLRSKRERRWMALGFVQRAQLI